VLDVRKSYSIVCSEIGYLPLVIEIQILHVAHSGVSPVLSPSLRAGY
jgi:hypothetical protein